MMTRILSVLILVVAAFLLPWWVTLLGIVYYTRWYSGLELVVLMVLVDAYVGVLWSSPYLSLGTMLVIAASVLLRGWLRTHTYSSV